MQLLYMHLLIIVVEMEYAIFGQRVFGDFEVDFGQGVFGLERHFRVTQTFHLYYGYALRNNAEFIGGAIREVDDASASVRTRSVTRTMTCLPLRSLVTRSSVPKG